MKVYRIRHKPTGEFVGAGLRPTKHPKIWTTRGHAVSAIKCRAGLFYHKDADEIISKYEVVEYDLVESQETRNED